MQDESNVHPIDGLSVSPQMILDTVQSRVEDLKGLLCLELSENDGVRLIHSGGLSIKEMSLMSYVLQAEIQIRIIQAQMDEEDGMGGDPC